MYNPVTVKKRNHYGSNFWEAYSSKLRRTVNFYSDLEYDHWIWLETDENVVEFCEQPLKITGEFEGKAASSILDMWIKWANGSEEFVEVKYSKDLLPSNIKYKDVYKQTKLQKEWCYDNNYKYSIKTEKEIRKNLVLLENMKTLLPYSRYKIPPEMDIFKVLTAIDPKCRTFTQIHQKIQLPLQRVKEVVFHLILAKKIESNINLMPLGHRTEVWSNNGE